MITPMVMKGFRDKCAQLGINANVMLKYAGEEEPKKEEKKPDAKGSTTDKVKKTVSEGAGKLKEMAGKGVAATRGAAQQVTNSTPWANVHRAIGGSPVGGFLHERGLTDTAMGAAGGGAIGAGAGALAGLAGGRKGRAKRALMGALVGGTGGALAGGGLGYLANAGSPT